MKSIWLHQPVVNWMVGNWLNSGYCCHLAVGHFQMPTDQDPPFQNGTFSVLPLRDIYRTCQKCRFRVERALCCARESERRRAGFWRRLFLRLPQNQNWWLVINWVTYLPILKLATAIAILTKLQKWVTCDYESFSTRNGITLSSGPL